MKYERFFTFVTAALLGFFTAWGAISCLITAFGLPLEFSSRLTAACLLAAMLSGLLLSFAKGGTVLLCLSALGCGYLYHDGTAARQFWQLLHFLSTVYNRAYDCGVLVLPDHLMGEAFFDWPLGIWGAVIAMAVCRSICCGKTVWLPMVITLAPLCSCIVVTDTVPGEPWLLMVMASLILLLLPSSVRRESHAQGLRLTAAVAIPLVLALAALFLAVPQNRYVNRSQQIRQEILDNVQRIPQIIETGLQQLSAPPPALPPKQIDLAALGPRIPATVPVMEVTAERSGSLYLRQQDFDRYDGLGWHATSDRQEPFSRANGSGESITVSLRKGQPLRFLPYYPAEEVQLRDGCLSQDPGETRYTIRRNHLPDHWRQAAYQSPISGSDTWTHYLELPENTRNHARSSLAGLYAETASNTEKADVIAAMVTSSARYDLKADRMPQGEEDFALWFLREGETGYCVHFATAATVLLRAAQIPARYVTGYLVEAEAGQPVTVTEENAHAWAEYYEPNLDLWLPLEATPASAPVLLAPDSPTAATEAVRPTEPTIPEPTLPATAPEETAPALPETAPEEPGNLPEEKNPGSPLVLLIPALLLILPVQRSVRLKLRRKRQHTGTTNQQALHRWQEALLLSRLLKESPTEELLILAQKAKFSQHQLTEEELAQFDSFSRSCLRRLRKKNRFRRLIDQYLHAAY